MKNRELIKAIKKFIKLFVYRPWGLKSIGRNSWILRPWKIEGRQSVQIGMNCLIRENSWLRAFDYYGATRLSPEIMIGNNVYIGRYSVVAAAGKIVIEDDCVLSEHVYITDQTHGYDPDGGAIMEQELNIRSPVIIGKSSFLGYRVAIMPGVILGEHCVVATNSVVTHSFPAFSMLGGVPARLIKTYSHEKREWIAA